MSQQSQVKSLLTRARNLIAEAMHEVFEWVEQEELK